MIVDLNIKGKQIVVFGGGREASRKVNGLLTQDCRINVIAEDFHEDLRLWAEEGKLDIKQDRSIKANCLEKWPDLYLVIAGTDNPNLNRELVEAARKRRCYAYAVDDPENSDFSHPAVINIMDTVQIALSTGGRSPLMARRLRERLEPLLRHSIESIDILSIRLQERLRPAVRSCFTNPDERKSFLTLIADDPKVLLLLDKNKFNEAEQKAFELLDIFKGRL